MIEGYVCSACGGSRFRDDEHGNLICDFCSTTYELAGQKYDCRVCGTLNPAHAKRCMKCGSALGRLCPICTHLNALGATICEKCDTVLDTYSSITARLPVSGEPERRVERLVETKWDDVTYMHAERARLDAEERERLAWLAAQAAENQRQQQQLIKFVLIGLGVFLALLALVAVATNLL